MVDELRDKHNRPLPGADLLLSNVYDQLMPDVMEVRDLGSGVIGGTECDHLAFRSKEVDWQIWIAQGDRPSPCRYVITSKLVADGPQYSVQLRNWKTGGEVASDDFSFKAPADAKKVDLTDLKNLKDVDELPSHFVIGGASDKVEESRLLAAGRFDRARRIRPCWAVANPRRERSCVDCRGQSRASTHTCQCRRDGATHGASLCVRRIQLLARPSHSVSTAPAFV